jgi:hypothetical protein
MTIYHFPIVDSADAVVDGQNIELSNDLAALETARFLRAGHRVHVWDEERPVATVEPHTSPRKVALSMHGNGAGREYFS